MSSTSPAHAAPQSQPVKVGQVTVQAFADRQAIAPGRDFNLLLSLTPEPGWYIYWQNPGASVGLPTEVRWNLPSDCLIGRVRFPAPKSKYEPVLKATMNVHEGATLLLTPARVAQSAEPGAEAKFTAKVSWLVCNKGQCVPGQADVSLTLPVVAPDAERKAANKKLFQKAHEALPLPTSKAEHVKLVGSVDQQAVKPGDKFTATLTAEIESGHHMQSHTPLLKDMIPAIVFVESTEGLQAGEVEYPKAVERQDSVLGKLSEYAGKVDFRIPVEVAEDAGKDPRWIRGVLQYQICTDQGTRCTPQHIEFTIPVRMKGGLEPKDADALQVARPPADESAGGTAGAEAGDEGHAAAPGAAGPTGTVSQNRSILIRAQEWLFSFGFAGVIVAGIIGGFVLNLMPCVLPVISLKVLSFVRQAHEDRWRVFRLGLVYGVGIMVFYIFLAIVFFVWGKGWGELFQNPVFVIVMAGVVLAFSMSLFGVFALFTPKVVNELGQQAESREGYLSAFATGILATVLGTACTAPFLSAAIAYASQLPPIQGTSIFLAVGFGMAFPFVVLTYNPKWLRFLPKPGPWMGVFEAIMGFVLLGTVIWLLNPLRDQIGDYGLLLTLIFLLAVAVAAWVKGKIRFGAPAARQAKLYATAVVVLAAGWLFPFHVIRTIPELVGEQIEHRDLRARGLRDKYGKKLDWSKGVPWQIYVHDLAIEDVRDGYTVFVDYTASWCASCKSNLKAFIEQPEVIAVMKELTVIPYEADYSLYNQEIKKDLERHGRAGVPMYLVYKPGDTDSPEVLPELLSKQVIIDALRRAGPSVPK